jgi:hypothetical protein
MKDQERAEEIFIQSFLLKNLIMAKALIKLACRQIIDSNSSTDFEKKIFSDSYAEFQMKIQAYNQENKFLRYSEIVANDGRANSLHYKCSFAVLHHIEALKNKIPGLMDSAGRFSIPFAVPEFKLLESGIADNSLHKVAIIYTTDILTLVDSFGEYLVLATGNQSASVANPGLETFTVKMQDNLSVINYREIVEEKAITFLEV